jgi:endo-1,4-beta-mannosidase
LPPSRCYTFKTAVLMILSKLKGRNLWLKENLTIISAAIIGMEAFLARRARAATGGDCCTDQYMDGHIAVARKLNKPLVMEEYGLPRDHHGYSLAEPTTCCDKYYENIFRLVLQHAKEKDALAGCNFWAYAGAGRPVAGQTYWKKGDDYLGDPPVEEQGLNSVFDKDTTMKVVARYAHLVNNAARGD